MAWVSGSLLRVGGGAQAAGSVQNLRLPTQGRGGALDEGGGRARQGGARGMELEGSRGESLCWSTSSGPPFYILSLFSNFFT